MSGVSRKKYSYSLILFHQFKIHLIPSDLKSLTCIRNFCSHILTYHSDTFPYGCYSHKITSSFFELLIIAPVFSTKLTNF